MSDDIDWTRVREKLAAGALRLAHQSSPEREAQILSERARKLAQPAATTDGGEGLAVLIFDVGRAHFAVESALVRTVTPAAPVARLPTESPFIEGVVNHRGEIIVVADARVLPGGARASSVTRRLLVLGAQRDELALAVDDVSDTRLLAADELLLATQSGGDRPLVRGVTRDGCTLIDAAALLADPRLTLTRTG